MIPELKKNGLLAKCRKGINRKRERIVYDGKENMGE